MNLAAQDGTRAVVTGFVPVKSWLALTCCGLALFAFSCRGDGQHAGTGTGGAATGGAAVGGESGSGGVTGAGGNGATNTGGSSASTGGVGAGGTSAGTGGAVGSGGLGGRVASGGATASGGAVGSGGVSGGSGGSSAVAVQLDKGKQTMEGFGIGDLFQPAMSGADADALFDVTHGLGLSILRIAMGDSGTFLSGNMAGDMALAKARGVKTFIGTVFSPPATCKTNMAVNDGGHLLPSCHEAWSDKITKFAMDNGLYAMSPANEPDFASCGVVEPCFGNFPSTLYTDVELVAFLKVVGPKLRAAGVKVLAPEARQWQRLWSNQSACCSEPSGKPSSNPLMGAGYDYGHALFADKTVWPLVDLIGVHQYDSLVAAAWPGDVSEKRPVWQTEVSGQKWWPEQGPSATIDNAVAVAGWIHDAIVVGEASAWLWWAHKSAFIDDNEGLVLKGAASPTKRFYTFGHYSRFIRPGFTRVEIGGVAAPADVLVSAYKGTDGRVVIVAINKGVTAVTVPIALTGGTAPASLTPWVTSATDNLLERPALALSAGSFTATLPSKSVTTFVGQ